MNVDTKRVLVELIKSGEIQEVHLQAGAFGKVSVTIKANLDAPVYHKAMERASAKENN